MTPLLAHDIWTTWTRVQPKLGLMSAMRQKRTFEWASAMFALPTIADQYLGTASYRN